MRIELELSDEFDERTLRVFGGVELLAERVPGSKWRVKIGHCSMCGKCCMTLKAHKHPFPVIGGQCIHLKKRPGNNSRYECFLRINRPFGCCVATPQNIPECTVKYEEI